MFIVREIFHLQFGRYREVKMLVDEGIQQKLLSHPPGTRILTDFTGEAYRLIIELPFLSMADFEKELSRELNGSSWKDWYDKLKPYIRYSEREILKQIN